MTAGASKLAPLLRLLDRSPALRNRLFEWALRWRMRHGSGPIVPEAAMVPLTLSSALGDRMSSAEILRMAERCVISNALILMDHRDLERGARAHEVRNTEPLLDLKRRGIGVVVCSIHLGPHFFVALELSALGLDQVAFAADGVIDRLGQPWQRAFASLTGRFESVPARGAQSLLHALRALRRGWSTVIVMDGQTGVGGPAGGRHHSVEVEILSLRVRLRTGGVYLAQRARVPLVLAAARRGKNGRREIEYSDPFPPPEGDGHEGRAERLEEMVKWFEPRIRRDPDQWSAWFFPLITWSRSGGAPTATRADLDRTRSRIEALLENGRAGAAVLRADPARVASLQLSGERVIIHGPSRRILEASPFTSGLLDAALKGVPVSKLPSLYPVGRSALADEVARMVLADLATIEG